MQMIHGNAILLNLVALAPLGLSAVAMGTRLLKSRVKLRLQRSTKRLILLLSLLILALTHSSFCQLGFDPLNSSFAWWVHLDAVAPAVAQILSGRTLLVDLPSQYGLYPELLAPLLLQADYDRLVQQIRDGVPSRILLGVKPESALPTIVLSSADLVRYKPVMKSREGTVVLLVRRE